MSVLLLSVVCLKCAEVEAQFDSAKSSFFFPSQQVPDLLGKKAVYEAEQIKGLPRRSRKSPAGNTPDIWAHHRPTSWMWSLMALGLFPRHTSPVLKGLFYSELFGVEHCATRVHKDLSIISTRNRKAQTAPLSSTPPRLLFPLLPREWWVLFALQGSRGAE